MNEQEEGAGGAVNRVRALYSCPDGSHGTPLQEYLPQQAGEFHYRVELTDAHLVYSATWLATGTPYFSFSADVPPDVRDVSHVALETHATGQLVWADNFVGSTACE